MSIKCSHSFWSPVIQVLTHRASGVILGLIALTMAVSAQAPTQEAFATPDEAAKMPQHGFKTTDMPLLDRMFTGTVQEFSSERPHRRQERPRGPSPNVGLDMLKSLLWTAIPAIPGCEKMWNSLSKSGPH